LITDHDINRDLLDEFVNDFGTAHDFKMFKESLADMLPETFWLCRTAGISA
jgi:hypothetical protein